MSWQTPEPDEVDLTDAEDTTEDAAAVLDEPAPSPYADLEQNTDGPQDEAP